MKITAILSATLCAAVMLTGCSNVSRFDYSSAYGAMPTFTPLPGAPTIGVLPAEDHRDYRSYPDEDNDNETGGSYYLGLLPFFPFGWHFMRHPEQSGGFATLSQFDFNPSEDLAVAAAISLKTSGLFAKVERVRDPNNCNCTYLWKTRLRNTNYCGYLFTYGITYLAAPVLWVFGFPDGLSSARLDIDFELVERSSGRVVWQFRNDVLGETMLHWIYARVGADADLYARLMKYAMARSLADLSARYPERQIPEKAPIAMKPACPRFRSPETPTFRFSPIAATI